MIQYYSLQSDKILSPQKIWKIKNNKIKIIADELLKVALNAAIIILVIQLVKITGKLTLT